ncbi:MAG: tetratricopeptide repeat protein, partial [Proteobacteria bacterium]|nr:tetratricopeptide repeat protein [Pseudomonadota bacterium]
RQEARELAGSGAQILSSAQRNQLAAARAEKDLERSLELLETLVQQASRSPEAWAALSVTREAAGDIVGAEQAAWLATKLAPLESAYLIRYGDLLAGYHAGRLDFDAIRAYEKALSRQGSSAELWYRKGRLEWRTGQLEAAIASFRRYGVLAPQGPHAKEVRHTVANFDRSLPEMPQLPATQAKPDGVSADAWLDFHVAMVYQLRQSEPGLREEDLGHALGRLDSVHEVAPAFVPALNLKASILVELGDLQNARLAYEQSLSLDQAQPNLLVELAQVVRQLGEDEEADELLHRAADLGATGAIFDIANAAVERGELLLARALLDTYFSAPVSSLTHDRAVALRETVDRRIFAWKAGVGGGVAFVALLPLLVLWRRRSGVALSVLLETAPGAYRDVARICSAIRHEVLKHNTTVLNSVADALEDRDPEPARWAAEKLYSSRGAVARFRGYISDLEDLGLAHGLRLNLRHRDQVFSPLIQAMDRLAKNEREMRTGVGRRLANELRVLSLALNQQGYRRLGALIRSVSILELDEAILRGIWSEVLREPAFKGVGELELNLDCDGREPILLRIYRGDLEDILANLLRNSIEASLECGSRRLGLYVAEEEDDVTGLERVELRVLDDAPKRISTAMIRGRYIEHGLGLAVDLVSRNGGSVYVEDQPGWSKATVVRLPRAEEGQEEQSADSGH